MRKDPTDLVHVKGNVWSNAAGLEWLKRQKPDPYASVRCEPNPHFICPFAKRGEGMPCLHPERASNRPLLVKIGTWNWEQIKVPIGQMSLFEPHRTHKVCWRNVKTGTVVEQYPTPSMVMVACKHMAVAHVRWMENKEGWTPLAWRIIPLDDSNEWREAMIEQHGFRACVFDVV